MLIQGELPTQSARRARARLKGQLAEHGLREAERQAKRVQ